MIHHPDWIGDRIERDGYYELRMLEYIKALKIPGTYFDIGANIGNHSVYFATECGVKVVAFEPAKENYDMLVQNVEGLNVKCYHCAIGKAGYYRYKIKPDNMGAIRLERAGMVEWADDRHDGEINHLDRYAYHAPILLKIDVEGMEIEVLKTATQIIKHFRPHVFIETDDPHKALDLLSRYKQITKFRPCTYHLKPM